MTDVIHVAELALDISALGPGRRFVLWVQGCCFSCPGCTSPEWQPLAGGTPWTVNSLAEHILKNANDTTEGATFSGGEPMLHAGVLLRLWEALKRERPHWSLIVYTGLALDEVLEGGDPSRIELARVADVLIDGRYIESLNDGRGLRGSSNQRIIFQSERYRGMEQHFQECDRTLDLEFRDDRILIVGVAPRGVREAVSAALAGKN